MSDYVIQVDATHAHAGNLPSDLIAVALYVTGIPYIQATGEDWARFPLAGKVRIDQSPDLTEFAAGRADLADIEPGAGTIATFLTAAKQRVAEGRESAAYIDFAAYPDLLGAVSSARIPGVRYGVANWSWSAAQAMTMLDDNEAWVLVQFASPISNPATRLPGSALTLAQAGADLSVKRAGWFSSPALAATAWAE
jgi:hypothetical protein